MRVEDSLTIKSKRGDRVTICVGDSIVKVDTPGKVLCKYCNGVINYGSKGRVAIIDHLKSEVLLILVSYFNPPKKENCFSAFKDMLIATF